VWIKAYTPTITFVLKNRVTKWAVLAVALTLFVATAALAPLLPTAFINAGSEKILSVTIAPPPGTSSEAVLERTIEAEQILIGIDDVELVQSSIPGEGDAGFQTIVAAQSGRPANSARITVVLDDSVDLTQAAKDLSDSLAPVKTDGYDVAVSQAAGFTSNNLNVIVSGDDADEV
jgi:HAE1 family hydrophobic/amphiphilic exporter-1